MKKTTILLLALCLSAMVFAGCGKGCGKSSSSKASKITDYYHYTDLTPGETYTIHGELLYKSDWVGKDGSTHFAGDNVLDSKGNKIEGEVTFTPEEPDGSVEIIFSFAPTDLGKDERAVILDQYGDK